MHLVWPFINQSETKSDKLNVLLVSKRWHPHYAPAPFITPFPCLHRRTHGYGKDHLGVSTDHKRPALYPIIHLAWEFLDVASRRTLSQVSLPINGYRILRSRAASAPIHQLRRPRAPPDGSPLDPQRVDLYAMALLRFDFNYGDFIRFMGGEYTYDTHHWDKTFEFLDMFEHHLPPAKDPVIYLHRARLLSEFGAPLVGHYSCDFTDVQRRNQYDNHKSVHEPSIVELLDKKLAKEESLSYQVVFPRWIWPFIYGLFIAPISFAPPKHQHDDGRLCTDLGTPLWEKDSGAINAQVPKPVKPHRPEEMADEARLDQNPPVFYGNAMIRALIWIYNLRIDEPLRDILLHCDDISAAFHRIRYHPSMAICYTVVHKGYLSIPIGVAFGGNNSGSLYMLHGEIRSWLGTNANFRLAQAALIPKLQIAAPPTARDIKKMVQVTKDALNPGANTMRRGPHQLGPQPSFVDDQLTSDTADRIVQAINCSTLSAYVMFQFPGSDRRPPCINEPKYDFRVLHWILFLGYIINTRSMTVEWPENKRERLANLLDTAWLNVATPSYIPAVSPKTASQVLGLIRNGALCSPFGVALSTRLQFHLNDAVSAAPRCTPRIPNPKQPDAKHIRNSWWRHHRLVVDWLTILDLKLLRYTLTGPKATLAWTQPISLIIPREPTGEPIGDASFEGMGGYCLKYGYMWRLSHADLKSCGLDIPKEDAELIQRYQAAKESGDTETVKHLAHINILEFIAIIINIWMFIKIGKKLESDPKFEHIIHARTDNTSALSWLMHASRTKKPPVRNLARHFQLLLTQTPVPYKLQPSHIAGKINENADLLSRPKSRAPSWASVILASNPSLRSCTPYQVPRKLLLHLAALINSKGTEDGLEQKTIRLWTLEANILGNGSWGQLGSRTSLSSGSSHKRRR